MTTEVDALPRTPFNPAAMVVLLVSGVFSGMATVSVAVILPELQRQFAAVPYVGVLVQLCGALAPTSLALSAPWIGRLVDKMDYRIVLLAGLVAFAMFGVAPAELDSLYLILLCRVGLGISAGAILVSALAALAVLPKARRSGILGVQTLIAGLGAIVVYPVVGALAQQGWRPAFMVHLASLAVLPLALALPKLTGAHVVLGHGDDGDSPGETGGGLILPLGLIAVAVLVGLVMFINGMFSPLFLQSIGVNKPALWALPPMVGGILGMGVAGGFGALHARFSLSALFAGALVLCSVGLAVCGLTSVFWVFIIGAALIGIGSTLFSPALTAAAIARAGEGRAGRAVGTAQGALFCSQVAFPFITAPLIHYGGLRSVYALFALAAAVSAAGYLSGVFREGWRSETRTRAAPAATISVS